jgi:2-C-methyl-D-erythritol 4-phosphate cytidylyltransferase
MVFELLNKIFYFTRLDTRPGSNLGLESVLVEASKSNLKITAAEDLTLANFYLKQNEN